MKRTVFFVVAVMGFVFAIGASATFAGGDLRKERLHKKRMPMKKHSRALPARPATPAVPGILPAKRATPAVPAPKVGQRVLFERLR